MRQSIKIHQIITLIRHLRGIDNEMPAQMAHCLLQVALNPGCTMRMIEQSTGLSQSSVSRNIQTLGEWHRDKKPGYGLVEAVEDPNDTRRKVAFLTPKGRRLMSDLLTAIADEPVTYEGVDAKSWVNEQRRQWMSAR